MKVDYSIAEIWEQMFSEEVRSVNFSDLSERFHNYEITKFDEKTTKDVWYAQYIFGCLMFALVNGNFEKDVLAKYLKKNEPLRAFSGVIPFRVIRSVIYEYKAILIWLKMSGNNVLGNITLRNVSGMVKNMLNQPVVDSAIEIAKNIRSLYLSYEQRFSIKVEKNGRKKDFSNGEWTFNNHKVMKLDNTKGLNTGKYLKLKTRLLKCLPKYSLYCKNNHWIVFLGCEADNMVFYDSENSHDLLRESEDKIVSSVDSILVR